MHDSIFRYSKTGNYFFKTIFEIDNKRKKTLERGYTTNLLKDGTRQLIIYKGNENKPNIELLKKKDKFDKIIIKNTLGRPLKDYWNINFIHPKSKERVGYSTQKPEELLERIIKASSNEGDLVLDPFIGSGTTAAVSNKLKRRFIGIDKSVQSIKISEMRLNNQKNLFSNPFNIKLHKYDYDKLINMNPFNFEKWIIKKFKGIPNEKQVKDYGIDGLKENIPIQVKQSEKLGRNVIDNFLSAIRRYDSSLVKDSKGNIIGYIIGFSFGSGLIKEIARLYNEDTINIKLLKVEDIVPISKKPKLKILTKYLKKKDDCLQEIEFTAKGEGTNGIEMYSWDWNYNDIDKFNAKVFLDEDGIQKHSFKSGNHTIGVKCVDSDGLECIEIVNLRINGVVRK